MTLFLQKRLELKKVQFLIINRISIIKKTIYEKTIFTIPYYIRFYIYN